MYKGGLIQNTKEITPAEAPKVVPPYKVKKLFVIRNNWVSVFEKRTFVISKKDFRDLTCKVSGIRTRIIVNRNKKSRVPK